MRIQGVESHDNVINASFNPATLRMRCPVCLHEAVLDPRGMDRLIRRGENARTLASGERVCPNPECKALIWVVYSLNDPAEILFSYPPERFDFDASDLPMVVREPLEEAVDCHANGCFKASALMIRRSLEALCEEGGIPSKGSLFDRIEALGRQVVLPTEMTEGMHNLRLLGNDAAHVEAREYLAIGEQEVEAALAVTKLILSATYQSSATLRALESLRVGADS